MEGTQIGRDTIMSKQSQLETDIKYISQALRHIEENVKSFGELLRSIERDKASRDELNMLRNEILGYQRQSAIDYASLKDEMHEEHAKMKDHVFNEDKAMSESITKLTTSFKIYIAIGACLGSTAGSVVAGFIVWKLTT